MPRRHRLDTVACNEAKGTEREDQMLAKDIMTQDVSTVSQDMRVGDVAKLLLARRISGVPVVDQKGKLCGVVSEGDLLDMRTNIIDHAYIQGRDVDLHNKQTQLAEKYENKYGIK